MLSSPVECFLNEPVKLSTKDRTIVSFFFALFPVGGSSCCCCCSLLSCWRFMLCCVSAAHATPKKNECMCGICHKRHIPVIRTSSNPWQFTICAVGYAWYTDDGQIINGQSTWWVRTDVIINCSKRQLSARFADCFGHRLLVNFLPHATVGRVTFGRERLLLTDGALLDWGTTRSIWNPSCVLLTFVFVAR